MYNWQFPNWANFVYDDSAIDSLVIDFTLELGEVNGIINSLSIENQQDTILQIMINEAIKTSEIEGEYFSRKDVMSSIKKHLGTTDTISLICDKKAQNIAKLMIEIRKSYNQKLTEKMLKSWHKILMNDNIYINSGKYRTGTQPMQVISGAYGKEIVHYQAPASERITDEMKKFIKWYQNFTFKQNDFKRILIKTAIAYLYFESIHPFEDGNGKVGRALAEKCLAESLNRPIFLSLSSVIEKDKKEYYKALKEAQKGLEITSWIIYFSSVILKAQKFAKKIILFILNKTKFLDGHKNKLNTRQQKVILKMFDLGIDGFEGGMTAKKYMSITKASKATATRDLQDLTQKNIFIQQGLGRNVKYELNFM